ncbi:uncharacterized protein LOC103523571 [Diaphorina citri]|uniref:Uncharacterized protein LOC103523571 n=1 Tax=Diaphorina citri TaxID=121845 RepID=A0A3Q0JKN0_DIACI|nr:uncharacterized protein LOC103523571 [Diaphorina citri]
MAANIIPRIWTYYISTVLFIIFGLKMLREGYKMSPNEGQEELEEVQSDLRKRDDELKARKKPGGSPPPLRRYPDEKHMDENAVFCDNVMNGGGDVEINVTRSTASSPIREAEPTILVSPGSNSNPDAITIVRINSTGNGLTNHSTSNGVEVLPKVSPRRPQGSVFGPHIFPCVVPG